METVDYGDTNLNHIIEGESRRNRDDEDFGRMGYTRQEFEGEELVDIDEDDEDLIELEDALDEEE